MDINKLKEESKSCLHLMNLQMNLLQIDANCKGINRILCYKISLLSREILDREFTKISQFIQECHKLTDEQLESDDELKAIASEVKRLEELQKNIQDDLAFDMTTFDSEGNYEFKETPQEIAEQIVPEIIQTVGNDPNALKKIIDTVIFLSKNDPTDVETLSKMLGVEVIFASAFLIWLETLGLVIKTPDGKFGITKRGYDFQNMKT